MNRKERRAARAQGTDRAGAGAAREGAAQPETFALAVRSHQAGQLDEAERLYRKVLAKDADHVSSLRNFGILALQTGRAELAVDLFGRLLAQDERIPDCHYNIALAFSALGRRDEAASHYLRAIDLKPDYAEAHMNLGNLRKEQGRLDDAIQCYRQVMRHAGESAPILYNLGNVLAEQGQFEEAEQRLRRAVAIAPGLPEPHNSLGNVLVERGKIEEALDAYRRALALAPRLVQACANIGNAMLLSGQSDAAAAQFQSALELDPNYPEAHNGLGAVRLSQGRAADALAHFERAIALRPRFLDAYVNAAAAALALGDAGAALQALRPALEARPTARVKSLFVECARWLQAPPAAADFEPTLRAALVESWGAAGDLTRLAARLLRDDAGVGGMIALAEQHWPARLSAQQMWGADGLQTVAGNALLGAMLAADRICDTSVEKFLTLQRSALLDMAWNAESTPADAPVLKLLCALAQHCFRNEYVYGTTDEERARVNALRTSLSDLLAAGREFPLLWLCVAAFAPLGTLPEAERLLQRAWPEPVEALLTQQVREPQQEQRLRAALEVMTPVADAVSRRVMAQYEESPYPRWRDVPAVDRPQSIEQYLRARFPTAGIDAGEQPRGDILVAGCGTGLQAIVTARRFPQARILAIDLSTASLAYATRRTVELGIANIEYAQADLLDIASTGRSFDVIETAGVLHHLADPFAGWRALLGVLRPGGFMLVSLYSALARASLGSARKWIADRRYGGSEDVARMRQDLLSQRADEGLGRVFESEDFYTTSSARDLLLHAHENEMRLPQIEAFLRDNELSLLGLEVDEAVRRQFRTRFPDEAALTDLGRWDAFEADNPWVFARMYSFWIRKDGSGRQVPG